VKAFKRDQLPDCIKGFEHINRYYDVKNKLYTAKILPGEYYVSKTGEMITTVLGSCISACINDPVAGIGGMNHFMLPVDRRSTLHKRKLLDTDIVSRYGDFAMEMLINSIISTGGKRKNLQVKIFGGGNVLSTIKSTNIGKQNIEFAHQYLEYENMKIIAEDTGDFYPRKVNYFSNNGKVRVKKLRTQNNETVNQREDSYYEKLLKSADESSELEQF